MKAFVIGVIFVLLTVVTVLAHSATYTLSPILEAEDPAKCAKSGGKAALVAEIDENGYLTTEWEAFCLNTVK